MGQESVAQLREALTPTLANFEERLTLVGGVEAQAAPALEQLDSLGQQLDGAIAALEAVQLDIGEGGVADALEGALGGGFDVAKQAALEPLRELQASIGPIREAAEAMVQSARMLTTPLTDAIARLHEALAQADNLPRLMTSMADQCVAVTSGGGLTSLE